LELYLKAHGRKGTIKFRPPYEVLTGTFFRFNDIEDAKKSFQNRLSHFVKVHFDGHGTLTVTRKNWYKYQEDTTHAERKQRARGVSETKEHEVERELEKEKELKEHTQASPDPKIIKKLGEAVKDLTLKTKTNFYPLVQKYIRLPPEKTLEIISNIIEKPWPYAEQALRTSLARHHLNLSVAEQEKYKQIFEEFIRGPP